MLTEEEEEEVEVIECRACSHLLKFKCAFCKCYVEGRGSGLCAKCAQRDETWSGLPQLDQKWSGVCVVCANFRRASRTRWNERVKGYDDYHGELWKALSVRVRRILEIRFQEIYDKTRDNMPNPLQKAQMYRKIADECGWISETDGKLHRHYHNWFRRMKYKCKSVTL